MLSFVLQMITHLQRHLIFHSLFLCLCAIICSPNDHTSPALLYLPFIFLCLCASLQHEWKHVKWKRSSGQVFGRGRIDFLKSTAIYIYVIRNNLTLSLWIVIDWGRTDFSSVKMVLWYDHNCLMITRRAKNVIML